jgi:hypothetical protein
MRQEAAGDAGQGTTVMTVAELTATPGVAPSDTDDVLEFRGRFRFGIDQWAYVPFDVPPGVRRIRVSTGHDRCSLFGVARNVLDLGIFGPAGHDLGNAEGFRGWSGGARTHFTLSAGDATPGYLAGPIDPGRWALALGPVVLNPLGMGWQAQIVLEHGAPGSRCEPTLPAVALPAPLRGRMPGRGRGWYRGDLHLHTVHSDGRHETADLAAAARAAGLDFIVSTDHNTSSANREWATSHTDGLLVVAGEEVTTRHGHWLAIGLPPAGWIDWRYAPTDDVFGRYASQVRDDGGMVVAAHPAVPMPGSAWEFGFCGVDAVEVWNGRWNVDDEVSLRIWHRLLRQGRRVAAVGGSDSHSAHQAVGLPQTVVHADELSTAALVHALRVGCCYVAESSDVTVHLTASCSDAGLTAEPGWRPDQHQPGGRLCAPPGAAITVSAAVSGAPGSRLALITAAGCVATADADRSGMGHLVWTTTSADAVFARLEVRRPARGRIGSMVALTNPVWLRP